MAAFIVVAVVAVAGSLVGEKLAEYESEAEFVKLLIRTQFNSPVAPRRSREDTHCVGMRFRAQFPA
jgi:hypothetical protein